MKKLFFLSLAFLLAGCAHIWVPSDAVIVEQIQDHMAEQVTDPFSQAVASLAGDLIINRHTLRIEKHFFYKNIYTITGDHIGYGYLGGVVFD